MMVLYRGHVTHRLLSLCHVLLRAGGGHYNICVGAAAGVGEKHGVMLCCRSCGMNGVSAILFHQLLL